MGEEKAGKWLKLWDPSEYLKDTTMPMLWVTGTNDGAYPMDSLQKSYRLPVGTRNLCIRIRMPHGHGGAGENPEEIHAFANSILKEGKPLARIVSQGINGNKISVKYAANTPIVKAELNYTNDLGKWLERLWVSEPADVDASANVVTALLPVDAKVYYVNLIDETGLAVSTEHSETDSKE